MQALEEEAISKENNFSGKDRKNLQHAQLEELLQAYRGYTTRMVSLQTTFQGDIEKLNEELKQTTNTQERDRIDEAIRLRTEGYAKTLTQMETENNGFAGNYSAVFRELQKKLWEKLLMKPKHLLANGKFARSYS